MVKKFFYRAYGLTLVSSLTFPELTPSVESEDNVDVVHIKEGTVSELSPLSLQLGYCVNLDADSALLYIGGSAAVRVTKGREIVFDPVSGVSDAALRLFLLGPALAMVLHQRGQLILHSSAIAFDVPASDISLNERVAVGFLGESGQGKSTTAAALYERGRGIVSDDIVAVPMTASAPSSCQSPAASAADTNTIVAPLIAPGFPRLKLRAPTVAALYNGDSGLSIIDKESEYPRHEKQATRSFFTDVVPLQHAYLLEDADTLQILPMSRKDALLCLIRNSYWIADLPERQRMEHFHQCNRLASVLPVFRLLRPRNIALLGDMLNLVEHHTNNLRKKELL